MDEQSTRSDRAHIWARISLSSGIVFVVSLLLLSFYEPDLFLDYDNVYSGEPLQHLTIQTITWYIGRINVVTAGISFLIFIVTSIGTASTVLTSWRNDRRQEREYKLNIQQLELQVEQLRRSTPEKTDPPQLPKKADPPQGSPP
jgi:hypothetical protein